MCNIEKLLLRSDNRFVITYNATGKSWERIVSQKEDIEKTVRLNYVCSPACYITVVLLTGSVAILAFLKPDLADL